MIELEDRILDRALAGESERVPVAEARERYDVPRRSSTASPSSRC